MSSHTSSGNFFKRRKSQPSPISSPTSPAEIDDVYERLKQLDRAWLAATLAQRDRDLGENNEGHDAVLAQDPTSVPSRRPLLHRLKRRSEHDGDEEAQFTTPLWPFDVTAQPLPQSIAITAYTRWVREHDWASTDVGPIASWSRELRRMVNMCLMDPRPAAVWWGKTKCLIYNPGYAAILSRRHPSALGRRFADVWPELADQFAASFERGETRGEASTGDDALYTTERNGYPEELWASWALFPIPAEHGNVGFYNVCFETTSRVIADRRMATLGRVQHMASTVTETEGFWRQVSLGLEPNDYDVPFAVLYAAAQSESDMPRHDSTQSGDADESASQASRRNAGTSSSEVSFTMANRSWTLEALIGLPGDCVLPSRIDGEAAGEAFIPSFAKAFSAGGVTLLTKEDDNFPKALYGIAKSRAFADECTAAALCPISPAGKDKVLGWLLLGINPRHAYDEDYQRFIGLLVRQIANSLASVVLVEEELARAREAANMAAQDQIRLSKQLEATRREAEDSETRFRDMANSAPVAMFHADELGNLIYANDKWFTLTLHPRDEFYPFSWKNLFHPDDMTMIMEQWVKCCAGQSVEFEVRLAAPYVTSEQVNGEHVQGDLWVITSAYTLKRDDGSVKAILGCLTDISRQKWIEQYHSRRTDEAVELKRQQENFMDMTSHEARNPLSAITLCAESIAEAVQGLLDDTTDPLAVSRASLQAQADSAETILSCASHQSQILEDVLTLSKLESGLLLITPVEARPVDVVKQAVRMFQGQTRKADIELSFDTAPSYTSMGIDWVLLDPSRVMQILINLLSNAVKFTQPRETRQIRVTLDASVQQPLVFDGNKAYVAHPSGNHDFCGCGHEDMYVSFIVSDTGQGITPDEMKRLFKRFQQANPRTHTQYGGSGLGLYTCRELARLHGGQIGVSSIADVGSTFAFYIKAHRCEPPVHKLLKKGSSSTVASRNSGMEARDKGSETPNGTALSILAVSAGSANIARKPIAEQHLLVVEDNLVNQKVFARQLTVAGYHASVANHGLEALAYVRASHFHVQPTADPPLALDLILMDVEMPVMDGLTAAQEIRAMQERGEIVGHIPVIAVTAYARAEQQAGALEAGMDSVVTKPFKMAELLSELERVRRRRLR